MVGALVQQLTRNLTAKEVEDGGYDAYYVNHGTDVYACSAAGIPFSAGATAAKGDPIADLTEDMAAEGAIAEEQQRSKGLIPKSFWWYASFPKLDMLRTYKNNFYDKGGSFTSISFCE